MHTISTTEDRNLTQCAEQIKQLDQVEGKVDLATPADIKIVITDEYQEAIDSVDRKDPLIFVNGKAGTGKSTLIHFLIEKLESEKKSVALVAPTGAAAILVGGVTINSFFKFAPSIIDLGNIRAPGKGREIYQELDILIVDEVSMVDANKLDGIDTFLRRARGSKKPFGGVQVVLVGDLFQLGPVLSNADIPRLREMGYDKGMLFFDAKVMNGLPIQQIELKTVFRQKNQEFADMLNKIRIADDIDCVVEQLNNACYAPGKASHPMSITLATTNSVADSKNEKEMTLLPGVSTLFVGEVCDEFGRSLPVPEKLNLKLGARVMFAVNDYNYRKEGSDSPRWANGSLGVVTAIRKSSVDVMLASGITVTAKSHTWESFQYVMVKGRMKREVSGTYEQMPLALAWAITIHKSQGKSLDHVHVDLGTGAFATGQAYVALSRCRTKEGMTFARPLKSRDVKCDSGILDFFDNLKGTQLF